MKAKKIKYYVSRKEQCIDEEPYRFKHVFYDDRVDIEFLNSNGEWQIDITYQIRYDFTHENDIWDLMEVTEQEMEEQIFLSNL